MSRGETHPPEGETTTDWRTGATIRQVTDARATAHHPFFHADAYDDATDWLVFVSHRTGRPEIFGERRATGELVQLTECPALDEWSVTAGPDGAHVYFTADGTARRVSTETYRTEVLADYAADLAPETATTGGPTNLSRDGRWWAVPLSVGEERLLTVVDTDSGDWDTVVRRGAVSHPQFCPDDPSLLFYAGPLDDRVWVVNRDGTGDCRLYHRSPGEWITHETWLPGRREVAFVDWPNGMRAVHVDTGRERRVTDCPAWHAASGRDGALMVADTNFPDVGLQVFDPRDGVGKWRTLCYPAASSIGEHWDGPFPYGDGPVETHSPQHTHPHPSVSPDGERVVYTSDRSGVAQVYEVALDEARTPPFGAD